MNPSGSGNGPNPASALCHSCQQFPAVSQNYLCSNCMVNNGNMYNIHPNPPTSGSQARAGPSQASNQAPSQPSQVPQAGSLPNYQPGAPAGPAGPNANFFPFFSSLEGVSEQEFNNAVFSEAGNLNFLGQNFASAVPPNFGNIHNSSSPNLSSLENESSQQPSDSNRFSSPPYEEEDDLNGIWVGDRTCADNVFYYGCFPGSLLGSTNKETQEVCEKLAILLQETNIEDDLAPPKDDITISTAAKRHLLDLYFRYHYPFFPVLHKPTIMTQFDQGKLPMLLLNVIFAIAIFYTDDKSYNFFPQLKEKTHDEVAQEFEAQAKKCLDECFSEAEIYTIQALLLMTLYHHRTTVSNNVWLYSGMATRMAMELGLHKDCENLLNGAFEPIEQEIRKKTWWGCFVLDTLYSTMLGRPLSIQQELCDVKLPTLADDEDDENEIPCTQVFIAMSKLGQIVGKLNRLLTSVKLKSNLQDRATRAHDCLVSLKNWFKSLPPSLKKIPESPPQNLESIKNCFSETNLIPFLHSFYYTAIIVGQVLCHTDGLFRVTNTNLMGDAVNAATEIVRIMTRFDSFYSTHSLSFKFYPLYVSAFLFLHKIKVSQPQAQGQQTSDSSKSSEQWYSLFLSCLTTLNKFSQKSENGRYAMTVLIGMADHQKVKLPEVFKRNQALIPTNSAASATDLGNQFFASAMGNPQAIFNMAGSGIDPQTLSELAAMSQNGQFNIDLSNAISSLSGANGQFPSPGMMGTSMSGAQGGAGAPYQTYGPEQFSLGMFRAEDLMNLSTGISDQYIESIMTGGQNYNAAAPPHIEELPSTHPSDTTNDNSGNKSLNSNYSQNNSSPSTQTQTHSSPQTTTQTHQQAYQQSQQQNYQQPQQQARQQTQQQTYQQQSQSQTSQQSKQQTNQQPKQQVQQSAYQQPHQNIPRQNQAQPKTQPQPQKKAQASSQQPKPVQQVTPPTYTQPMASYSQAQMPGQGYANPQHSYAQTQNYSAPQNTSQTYQQSAYTSNATSLPTQQHPAYTQSQHLSQGYITQMQGQSYQGQHNYSNPAVTHASQVYDQQVPVQQYNQMYQQGQVPIYVDPQQSYHSSQQDYQTTQQDQYQPQSYQQQPQQQQSQQQQPQQQPHQQQQNMQGNYQQQTYHSSNSQYPHGQNYQQNQ